MVGTIRTRNVIRRPVYMIRYFGVRVFFACLIAGPTRKTFLEICQKCGKLG